MKCKRSVKPMDNKRKASPLRDPKSNQVDKGALARKEAEKNRARSAIQAELIKSHNEKKTVIKNLKD